MNKLVVLDTNLIQNWMAKQEFTQLSRYLKDNFAIEKDSQGNLKKFTYSDEVVSIIHNLLCNVIITTNTAKEELLREIFRALRNYASTDSKDNWTRNCDFFLNDVQAILADLARHKSSSNSVQIILQFLVNFVINNQLGAEKINGKFHETLMMLLEDKICVYEITALLYNLMLQHSLMDLNLRFYINLLDSYQVEERVEYIEFMLESLLDKEDFLINYEHYELVHRINILKLMRQQQIIGESLNLTNPIIDLLIKRFLRSSPIIFQSKDENVDEAFEVSLLVEVIAALSSQKEYLSLLQNDKDLLITSGVLLINLHNLGKESDNFFTITERLSQIAVNEEEIRQHPAYGFKVSLVRIIGNLCWKNEKVQDLVREAELIPVLLDCCKIDVKNPFIMQWIIFAIRNLCENNYKNQAVIAGLHRQGTVSSRILEEVGLTLHDDGNEHQIRIIPMEHFR